MEVSVSGLCELAVGPVAIGVKYAVVAQIAVVLLAVGASRADAGPGFVPVNGDLPGAQFDVVDLSTLLLWAAIPV